MGHASNTVEGCPARCTGPGGFELMYISRNSFVKPRNTSLNTPSKLPEQAEKPRNATCLSSFLAPLGDASNNAETLDRRRGAFFGALVADALCLGSHYGQLTYYQ